MDLTCRHPFQPEIGNNQTLHHFLMCLNVQVYRLVRQKNRPAWLLLLRAAAENPRSTLPEQVSKSAETWIRDPIGVSRCSAQSGTPYIQPSVSNRLFRIWWNASVRRVGGKPFNALWSIWTIHDCTTTEKVKQLLLYQNPVESLPQLTVQVYKLSINALS
jgi:hypothetical protein